MRVRGSGNVGEGLAAQGDVAVAGFAGSPRVISAAETGREEPSHTPLNTVSVHVVAEGTVIHHRGAQRRRPSRAVLTSDNVHGGSHYNSSA